MVSVFFVVLVLGCGAGVSRGLRLPLNVAPLAGLAGIAVLTTWCARLGAPPLLSSGLIVAGAGLGLISLGARARRAKVEAAVGAGDRNEAREWRVPLLLLAISAAIPAPMSGSAFAGVEAPVPAHDGA